MAKRNSSWMARLRVRAKLRMPAGITLSNNETLALADVYRDDVTVLKNNNDEVGKAIRATENTTSFDIDKAASTKRMAVANFRQTKDPVRKREWARRVVVADQTLGTMRKIKKRMTATHDRLLMIKGDLELQILEAEARATEADAYAKAGKQLRLVGDRLISARSRAESMRFEYENLEVTMEAAEKFVDSTKPDKLVEQAKKIAGIK